MPGGVAQLDNRLFPGDRLMFVNDVSLEHATLDVAVQALKGAPRGTVILGVTKPLPLPGVREGGHTDDIIVGFNLIFFRFLFSGNFSRGTWFHWCRVICRDSYPSLPILCANSTSRVFKYETCFIIIIIISTVLWVSEWVITQNLHMRRYVVYCSGGNLV